MKYSYQATGTEFDQGGKFIWMPYVETVISGPKGSRRVFALVDSGAAYCMASMEYASILGVDLDTTRGVQTYGVTGTQNTKASYPADVKIRVNHLDEIKIPVYFLETDSFAFILGQKDFFEAFRIKFEKDHNTFEITPTKR